MSWQFFFNFLPIIIGVGGIVLGLVVGLWIDREHRQTLNYRRGQVGHVLVTDLKSYPGRLDGPKGQQVEMLVAEYVLSNNFFLTFIAKFKMFFGGEIKSFHGVVTRLRQEVVIRLMEQAAESGYNALGNVRLEAVDVAGATVSNGKQRKMYVGMIAYGTAYHRDQDVFPPPAPPQLEAAPS